MRRAIGLFALVAGVVAFLAPDASAQSPRVLISSTVAGAVGDGGPASALAFAGGFDLAPHAGLELELLYVPGQEFQRNDLVVPQLFPPVSPVPMTTTGHTIAVLTSFVASTEIGRLRPYALIGGGFATVERRAHGTAGSVAMSGATSVAATTTTTESESNPALTTGGGLEIRLWKHLGVAADVRYLRLLGAMPDAAGVEHLTRVGARVGYRF